MQITDFTTYADVRAILGVSEEEIEDSTLALTSWATLVEMRLEAISDTLATVYDEVNALATKTTTQEKFLNTVKLYVGYAFAEELLASQPMFGFKRVTDGKAEIERFDAWEDVKDGVTRGAASVKSRIKYLLSQISSYEVVSYRPTLIVSTGIATDPVTNT